MNREIKFRAWDGKQMYFPCDTRYDTSVVFNEWGWEVFSHFTGSPETLVADFENKDAVIMQYTGLKDKNGKDIYEADIIEGDNGVKYIVVWMEQLAAFYLSCPNTQRGKEFISCAASKVADEPMLLFKEAVIGNIYENSEILTPPIQKEGIK